MLSGESDVRRHKQNTRNLRSEQFQNEPAFTLVVVQTCYVSHMITAATKQPNLHQCGLAETAMIRMLKTMKVVRTPHVKKVVVMVVVVAAVVAEVLLVVVAELVAAAAERGREELAVLVWDYWSPPLDSSSQACNNRQSDTTSSTPPTCDTFTAPSTKPLPQPCPLKPRPSHGVCAIVNLRADRPCTKKREANYTRHAHHNKTKNQAAVVWFLVILSAFWLCS